MTTVAQLIEHLKQFPSETKVVYVAYSDYIELSLNQVALV